MAPSAATSCRRFVVMLLVTGSLTLGLRSLASAADWNQWRGPKRDGVATGIKPPTDWPGELQKRWQVDVGLGHASPVIAGRRAFVFSRRGEDEVLAAIDLANGHELWHRGYPAPYTINPAAVNHGRGPKSTPALAGSRIFTLGINGIVTAWDTKDGKILWQREFAKQFPKTSPLYGAASSPVVDGERLIVHVGGHDKGALLALELQTGETLWTAADDGPSYASPIVVEIAGTRQVVTQTQKACVGIGLEDGQLLWSIPYQTDYDQNSVTPIEHEESILFSGLGQGVDRYRIERVDDQWEVTNTWDNKEVSEYMSTGVLAGEVLFGFSHRHKGELFALDITTGKTLWTSDGRMGENVSLVRTGKAIWALTNEARLLVFAVNDAKYEQLAEYKVSTTPTWAHPVIRSDGVLVKDETQLIFWRFAAEP